MLTKERDTLQTQLANNQKKLEEDKAAKEDSVSTPSIFIVQAKSC